MIHMLAQPCCGGVSLCNATPRLFTSVRADGVRLGYLGCRQRYLLRVVAS